MAVLIDIVGTEVLGGVASASPQTYTGLTTGSSLSNGCVTFIVIYDNLAVTGTSATWDGVACTLIASQTSGGISGRVEVWGLSPIGTHTGNKTFSITFAGGTAQLVIQGQSWTGADQTGGTTTFNNSAATSGNSSLASGTITSQVGDALIAGYVASSATTTPNNGIIIFTENGANNYDCAANRDVGAASVAMNAAVSGVNTWAMAGANILQVTSSSAQPRAPHITKLPPFPFIPTPQPSYNAALYTVTIVLPFNQTDWSNTFRVSDWLPQPQVGINPNLFTNPFPFNQTDWSVTDRVPKAPFIPTDPLNINLFTNSYPFNQIDWSKPFLVPLSLPQPSPPLNPNLFTNPYPFNQYDWTKPVRIPQAPIDLSFQFNQNLTNFFPFNQIDWSKPFNVPHAPFDLSVSLNPNIFTNSYPVLNIDTSRPARLAGLSQVDTPYNQSLYTVTISATPFNQTDWFKPFSVQHAPFDLSVPLNPNIFTNPIPVLNIDASRPIHLAGLPQVNSPYNQTLYTVTISATPFNQTYWPPASRVPNAPVDFYNLVLYSVTILPFNQIDWSKPFTVSRAPFDQSVPLNLNLFTNPYPVLNINSAIVPSRRATVLVDQIYNQSLYTVTVTAPFYAAEILFLRKPVSSPLLDPPLNINLFTNPIPTFNYDGSIPVRTRGFVDTSQPYNINLYGIVTVQVPFNQVDWSRPFVPRPAPTQDLALNINLFTNPTPFSQYDWRKPFGVPHAPFDLSVQTNPNLFTNSFPFNQYQYPTQRPVKLGPPHVPPYNQNLYTATLGTTSHIVKFIGNVGHFMIR